MIDFDKNEDFFLHKHVKITLFIIMSIIIIVYMIIEYDEDEDAELIKNDYEMYNEIENLSHDQQVAIKEHIYKIINNKKMNSSKRNKIYKDFQFYFLQGAAVGLFTPVGFINSLLATTAFCVVHSCALLLSK